MTYRVVFVGIISSVCFLTLTLQKEVERLALEAKAKKDELMKVQSQINDAQKLASDTKAEEERLRKTIEDMELQAAGTEAAGVAERGLLVPDPAQAEPRQQRLRGLRGSHGDGRHAVQGVACARSGAVGIRWGAEPTLGRGRVQSERDGRWWWVLHP
jgi:hypothetical protein